jgi:hypothetical protein
MPNLEGMTAAKQLYKWFSDLVSSLPLTTPAARRVPYDEFIGPVYEIERFADLYARVESDERIDEVYQRIVHWMHRHGHLAILAHELCFELGVATGAIEKPGEFDENTTAERVRWPGTDRVGAELLSAGLLAELAKREDVDLSHALAKLEPDVLIDALMSVDVDVLERIAARRTANGAPERDSDGAITSKWSRGDDAAAAERDDGVPTSADDTPTAPASPLALLEPGPALPDLPLPAPAPAPAHPAVDEVAAYAPSSPNSGSRRRRWIIGTGVAAVAAAAAVIVAMLTGTPESRGEPAPPLVVTDYTYPTCEPTTSEIPTRTEVGATAPLERRASLEQFGADMDTLIIREPENETHVTVTTKQRDHGVQRRGAHERVRVLDRSGSSAESPGVEITVSGRRARVIVE